MAETNAQPPIARIPSAHMIRLLMRHGGMDTLAIAKSAGVRECEIWNSLAKEDAGLKS